MRLLTQLSAPMMAFALCQFAMFGVVSSCANAAHPNTFLNLQKLEQTVTPFAEKGFQGVIVVANKQGIIFNRAIGQAIDGKSAYTPSTVVDIASVSKQFTSAAIMKLAEQGRIDISAPLSRYIRELPADKAKITIHQLLTHTAGFKRHLGRDEDVLNREDFLKQVKALPLTFKPGDTYHYSNIGYALLAYLIEILSDQSYEDFLFEALLAPAGMFSTGYERPDWSDRTIPEISKPYAGYLSPLSLLENAQGHYWNLIGSGGLMSTTEDMVRWHQALLGNTLLSEASKARMFSAHVPEHDEGYYYGYGWSVVPQEGREPLIWHNGMSFFGKAEYWRLPESGLMIFVASHQGDVEPWHIADALYQLIR